MADEKDSKWQCYIIPDLAAWTGAAGNKPHTPIEFYDTYEQAAARLTFGVQQDDPPSARMPLPAPSTMCGTTG